MKVVINKCFGGFSISTEALERYITLKGAEIIEKRKNPTAFAGYHGHWWMLSKSLPGADGPNDECPRPHFYVSGISFGPEREMGSEGRDIPRNDPELVAVVEELGDKANGSCARLVVVEIPDGVEFEIAEYDGREHIAESHRKRC